MMRRARSHNKSQGHGLCWKKMLTKNLHMKNIYCTFMIILNLSFITLNAQAQNNFVYLFPNNNVDIGFGKSATTNTDLSLVVNGPLYGSDMLPVGGYVVLENKDGLVVPVQKKAWVNPANYKGNFAEDNGIFGLSTSNQMILMRYKDWEKQPEDLLWGFQNGMILLLKGKNLHSVSSASKYIRSGIGYRDDGSLVIVVSDIPINFFELGLALQNAGCQNAIYLDGSSSAVGYRTLQSTVGLQHDGVKLQFYH